MNWYRWIYKCELWFSALEFEIIDYVELVYKTIKSVI